jgi:uncharacterized protein YraI
LKIRADPNISGAQVGTIPPDGAGIFNEGCTNGWCRVKYKCLAGWVSAHFLSPRQSQVVRVIGVDANDRDRGLNVHAGPGFSFPVTGTVSYNATDVVSHDCEVKEGREWCLITTPSASGWAVARYLAR